MIKLCDLNDLKVIEEFCSSADPLAVYALCRVKCYGFSMRFCETWLCKNGEDVVAVLSVLCNNAVLYSKENADFDEIRVFLCASEFNTLLTQTSVAENLGFEKYKRKQALLFKGDCSEVFCSDLADYVQIYSLLCECFPHEYSDDKEHYLEWLSDLTFRKRRGFARTKAIFEKNRLSANVLTVAETETAAVIGGVCCSHSRRGCGLGSKVVLSAVNELKNENRDVFVLANDDVADGFYKRIGFSQYKNIAYIERQ